MKSLLLAATVLAWLAGPALAGCADGLKQLDAVLTGPDLAPDLATQLQDMRQQAEKLCSSGNDQEAADVIAEALAAVAAQGQ
jgi:hypothetical protein